MALGQWAVNLFLVAVFNPNGKVKAKDWGLGDSVGLEEDTSYCLQLEACPASPGQQSQVLLHAVLGEETSGGTPGASSVSCLHT